MEKPNQIAVRIQVVLLCGFNQTVNHSAGLGPGRGIGEQPILPAHHKGLYAALGAVVGQLQPAVLQIADEIRPLFPQKSWKAPILNWTPW